MAFDSSRNKRAKPRHDLYFYLKVIDADSKKIAGRIVDITTDGMMLVNDCALEVGSTHRAKITLAEDLFGVASQDVDVSFTVQWNKPDLNPAHFVNGVKFKDLSSSNAKYIEQIIRKIGFVEKH